MPIDLKIDILFKSYQIKHLNQFTLPDEQENQIKKPVKWYNKIYIEKMLTINKEEEYKEFISNSNNLIIYSKGSKFLNNVYGGFILIKNNQKVYEKVYKLSSFCSSFTAELSVIEESLRILTTYHLRIKFENLLIVTKNSSAIEAIINYKKYDDQITSIHSLIKILSSKIFFNLTKLIDQNILKSISSLIKLSRNSNDT